MDARFDAQPVPPCPHLLDLPVPDCVLPWQCSPGLDMGTRRRAYRLTGPLVEGHGNQGAAYGRPGAYVEPRCHRDRLEHLVGWHAAEALSSRPCCERSGLPGGRPGGHPYRRRHEHPLGHPFLVAAQPLRWPQVAQACAVRRKSHRPHFRRRGGVGIVEFTARLGSEAYGSRLGRRRERDDLRLPWPRRCRHSREQLPRRQEGDHRRLGRPSHHLDRRLVLRAPHNPRLGRAHRRGRARRRPPRGDGQPP
mmetsp:Transcript_80060/g.232440  ORF Transcript_80060/g.232440 Transcript_80060/m.232440 type:complete len:250 (+) Transcript_80060:424-1173(+)